MDAHENARNVILSFARLKLGDDAQLVRLTFDHEADWWVGRIESKAQGAYRMAARPVSGRWKVIDYSRTF